LRSVRYAANTLIRISAPIPNAAQVDAHTKSTI
jgi:hypothetical protein